MDRKFRRPRCWSNEQLRKIAPFASGRVVNVSAWKDEDKEGQRYKDYFSNASDYWLTNYEAEARGFQGNLDNEIFLDLTQPLDVVMKNAFDVVFNHTVLEHVFDVHTAFANLCGMTRDLVIIVVPFLQEEHADYGDFWRFTPQAVDRLFKLNGMETLYLSYNEDSNASIYVVGVASRTPERWGAIVSLPDNRLGYVNDGLPKPGINVIRNSFLDRLRAKIGIG